MHFVRRPNRHRFLYLVRHGQYERTPSLPHGRLTELGRRQAEHIADRLQTVPFDSVWSSTMSRAEETATVIRDRHFPHLPLQRSLLLREKAFPCDHAYYENARPGFRAPDDRVQRIAARWLRPSNRERHELIVAHGNVIRVILMHVLQNDLDHWINVGTFNCGLTRIVCRDDGRVVLWSHNETSHLPDEYITYN